ncbi:MAG: hypothetical protein HOW73_16855 [Polyangiaceae bacterium]|nr:hypothetical protein [Polyangiaceae bacterium]
MLRSDNEIASPTPAVFESGLSSIPANTPTLVVSAIGTLSCCDLWISQPERADQQMRLSIFGRMGEARVLLASADSSTFQWTSDGAREHALAISVRGRPVTAFEVECLVTKGENVADVNFALVAWHGDSPHDVTYGPAPTTAQGAAAPSNGRWPVYLSDGAQPQGTITNALWVRRAEPASFSAASDRILSSGISVGTVSLGALWHPRTSARRVEIRRIVISYWGTAAAGSLRIRGTRLTGTSGPTAGTDLLPLPHDRADSTTMVLKIQGDVTNRSATDFFTLVLKPDEKGTFEWDAGRDGKPIVLRAGQDEGFEVCCVVAAALSPATATNFGLSIHWTEV